MRRGILSGVASLVLSCAVIFVPLSAAADERDDAAKEQYNAEKHINDLNAEVDGLDADLAKVLAELTEVVSQVADAEQELAAAEQRLVVAEREYQQVKDQLTAAESEQDELDRQLSQAASHEEELTSAVGAMARDMYRGGEPTTLELMMTSNDAADIAGRVASVTTTVRAQSQALDSVRQTMTLTRNQADQAEAVTKRIAGLEASEAEKLAAEETAREAVKDHIDSLNAKQIDLKAKEAAWNARKAEAQAQLAQWKKERDAAAAKVAKIDEENRKKRTTFSGSGSSGAMFLSPLPGGVVTSNYGWRVHPIFDERIFHDGTDFGAGCGVAQYAVREGVVAASYYDSGGGNMVIINHGLIGGSSWTSEHLHLESAAVSVGQRVLPTTVIGYTGSTGNSTGCHLHLTITKDGATVNPLDYM